MEVHHVVALKTFKSSPYLVFVLKTRLFHTHAERSSQPSGIGVLRPLLNGSTA